MDLREFITRQEALIKEIVSTGPVDLTTVGQAIVKIRIVLKDLQHFVAKYTFKNVDEEIFFFKTVKPALFSSYLYHKKIFALLLFDSYSDANSRLSNYRAMLKKFESFARRNRAFYEYCVSGSIDMDHMYFTRSASIAVGTDEKFSTLYDYKLAKILAHQNLRDFVLQSIRKVESDASPIASASLQWTVSKASLVELMYALHACGVFNRGNTDLKHIAEVFESMFGVNLSNYAKVFAEVKMRKNGNTIFLDQMKQRLTLLIEESY